MQDRWHPKLGDRLYRPRRIRPFGLERVLGLPAILSAAYTTVGSSIYYAPGIVALAALGATPVVVGIAAIIFVFNALTYAEGSAMIPEGGGSPSFARNAFNDLVSFITGWAVLLGYIATIAIAAYTIPPYLSYFWPVLNDPVLDTLIAMGIVAFLMLINIIGPAASSRWNALIAGVDLTTQVALVVAGVLLLLIPHPGVLVKNMFGPGNWPSPANLVFGIAMGALLFRGIGIVSQLTEETREPGKRVPRAYVLMIIVVVLVLSSVSIVALSTMTPQMLGNPITGWARHPVAGIAANLPSPLLQSIFRPLVAVLATLILLTAGNVGIQSVSRLIYSLSIHRQLPGAFRQVHRRLRTPYATIVLVSLITVLALLPGFFSFNFFADLGSLFVFGSLFGYAMGHASIIVLRFTHPDVARPFRVGWNIRVRGRPVPLTAMLGLVATLGIWLVIVATNTYGRQAGLVWMLVGMVVYYLYRRASGIPLTHPPGPDR